MTVVGVDACKTGWIAVTIDRASVAAHHLAVIDDLTAVVAAPAAVGIDIPIGLPDAGRRSADVQARRFLGARRNSVFFTPVREVLEAVTHDEASSLSRLLAGSGVSRQSYGLARKVLEVDRWLPSAPCGVWEVHPEVSFALMTGAPARASKKTWAGMVERRDALMASGIDLDRVAYAAASVTGIDDMLDAGAVAWSAARVLAGTARCFPDPPEEGAGGRLVAIWG